MPIKQDKYQFWTMGEGDGRNQALFEYQSILAHKGYSHDQAGEVSRLINEFVFNDPLPDNELESVCRAEAFPEPRRNIPDPPDNSSMLPWFSDESMGDRYFLHNVMGEQIKEDFHTVAKNGQLYVYRDGFYQPGDIVVQREMIRLFEDIRASQRSEVMKYLLIQSNVDNVKVDPKSINVINGRLNLQTFNLEAHSPEHLDFQRVNAHFDPAVFLLV